MFIPAVISIKQLTSGVMVKVNNITTMEGNNAIKSDD